MISTHQNCSFQIGSSVFELLHCVIHAEALCKHLGELLTQWFISILIQYMIWGAGASPPHSPLPRSYSTEPEDSRNYGASLY